MTVSADNNAAKAIFKGFQLPKIITAKARKPIPATPISKTITEIKFRTKFTQPAIIRKTSGLFVSPIALRIALPKL